MLYGVLSAMPIRPDVVVSGINFGQNLGNVTELSGTVGAARTANRLGIPAIAISQGFAATDQLRPGGLHRPRLDRVVPPELRVRVVERRRRSNFNVPSCPSGERSGASRRRRSAARRMSAATRCSRVRSATARSHRPSSRKNALATANCLSTETGFDNDIDAFNNGFITLTVLNQDLGDR